MVCGIIIEKHSHECPSPEHHPRHRKYRFFRSLCGHRTQCFEARTSPRHVWYLLVLSGADIYVSRPTQTLRENSRARSILSNEPFFFVFWYTKTLEYFHHILYGDENHKQEKQTETNNIESVSDNWFYRTTYYRLDKNKKYTSAIERWKWDEIEHSKIE